MSVKWASINARGSQGQTEVNIKKRNKVSEAAGHHASVMRRKGQG